MRFDHTSLPLVLRTCSRIVAAVETFRLTATGLTTARVAGWTMRRAATTTAAAFDVPVSTPGVTAVVTLPWIRTVPALSPIGAVGLNVTLSRHVRPGATLVQSTFVAVNGPVVDTPVTVRLLAAP